MANVRIRSNMSFPNMIILMSEGNPEVIAICKEILQKGKEIDPDDYTGGLGALLDLDTLNIYGMRIYLLWNDVCDRDVAKMLAILRAWQLGQLAGMTKKTINYAIDNQGEGINLEEIGKAVTERLPDFKLKVAIT